MTDRTAVEMAAEALRKIARSSNDVWAVEIAKEALAALTAESARVSPDREALGRVVREAWIKWALQQPNPKPSWLVPWEGLIDKVDRLEAENATLKQERDQIIAERAADRKRDDEVLYHVNRCTAAVVTERDKLLADVDGLTVARDAAEAECDRLRQALTDEREACAKIAASDFGGECRLPQDIKPETPCSICSDLGTFDRDAPPSKCVGFAKNRIAAAIRARVLSASETEEGG